MCGKISRFIVFTFLENALNLDIFIHAALSSLSLSLSLSLFLSLSLSLSLTHTNSPRHFFFENLFPPTPESGGGNYDWLY